MEKNVAGGSNCRGYRDGAIAFMAERCNCNERERWREREMKERASF